MAVQGLCCCSGFSLVGASRIYSACGAQASRWGDFSWGAWAVGLRASVVVALGF